ncbi:hypothetical protein H2203_005751 [Taxawa tesnikishii (nom. ined.)]|nr:hypothetical protein H2203_005751 [Dothideales sp. JES 119]
MSEELKDASRVLLREMMWATLVNGILGVVMMVTFCFAVGDNLDQLLYNVTGSTAASIVMAVVLIVLQLFSAITTIAFSSRQTWAFAGDLGFPGSRWLSAINFGSEAALDAIKSVSNSALLLSYIICIGCVRLKRLRGQPLLPRSFDLGHWGGPINDAALAFLIVGFVFSFFSTDVEPEAFDMDWAVVIFFGVGALAGIYYHFIGGKHQYTSPKSLTKQT